MRRIPTTRRECMLNPFDKIVIDADEQTASPVTESRAAFVNSATEFLRQLDRALALQYTTLDSSIDNDGMVPIGSWVLWRTNPIMGRDRIQLQNSLRNETTEFLADYEIDQLRNQLRLIIVRKDKQAFTLLDHVSLTTLLTYLHEKFP